MSSEKLGIILGGGIRKKQAKREPSFVPPRQSPILIADVRPERAGHTSPAGHF